MIFGLSLSAPELFLIMLVSGIVMFVSTFRAKRLANGNIGQELKSRQRAIYGPVWILATIALIVCVVVTWKAVGAPLGILCLIVAIFLLGCTCTNLLIAWPYPREE